VFDGTYEYVILCAQGYTWWADIWGSSIVYHAPVGGDCWNGVDEPYNNYAFTVAGADMTVAVCGNSCDAECCEGDSWISDCGCVAFDNSGDDCDDCAGVPNGEAVYDNCGEECISANPAADCSTYCDADSSNDCAQDCNGIWGGVEVEDECGVCGGDGIADGACDCYGNVVDECGVCSGNNEAIDECGVCFGNDWDYCDGDGDGIPNIEDWGFAAHSIIVTDVPDDQGGRVYVNFQSAYYDFYWGNDDTTLEVHVYSTALIIWNICDNNTMRSKAPVFNIWYTIAIAITVIPIIPKTNSAFIYSFIISRTYTAFIYYITITIACTICYAITSTYSTFIFYLYTTPNSITILCTVIGAVSITICRTVSRRVS
jgi:hypothetical protein